MDDVDRRAYEVVAAYVAVRDRRACDRRGHQPDCPRAYYDDELLAVVAGLACWLDDHSPVCLVQRAMLDRWLDPFSSA